MRKKNRNKISFLRKNAFLITTLIIAFVGIRTIVLAISGNNEVKPNKDATVGETYVDYKLSESNSTSDALSLPITSNSTLQNARQYRIEDNPYNNYEDELNLTVPAAILIDVNENKILYEKNAYQKMYPASTTKAVTAILATEKCDLTQMVKVSYWAVKSVPSNYSEAHLVSGESISVKDLLYSMMIESANDSAYVLAQYMANNCTNSYPTDSSDSAKQTFSDNIQTFAQMMNNKAKEIGCLNTNFVNPNGIHALNHYSCAYDLGIIGKYAYGIDLLKNIVSQKSYTLSNTDKYTGDARVAKTTNLLFKEGSNSYYEYATGFKTGYTEAAKSCMIATADKDDRSLVCVVLHSEATEEADSSREANIKKLFEYGFNEYKYTTLVDTNTAVQSVTIRNGTKDTKKLDLVPKENLKILLNNNDTKTLNLNPDIKITKKLAPIKKGDVMGKISYTIDNVKYETDLLAADDVEPNNYFIYIGLIFVAFIIALIIVVIETKKKY